MKPQENKAQIYYHLQDCGDLNEVRVTIYLNTKEKEFTFNSKLGHKFTINEENLNNLLFWIGEINQDLASILNLPSKEVKKEEKLTQSF